MIVNIPKKQQNQKGQVLVIVLIFMAVILISVVIILGLVNFFQYNTARAIAVEQAHHLAEAGIDNAIFELNQTAGTYTGEADTPLGLGVFTVTVTNLSLNNKLITSTGYIPNSLAPKAQKTIKAQTNPSAANVEFRYGVQVGYGGLEMQNNAEIIGNVYANGSIDGANGAKITGDAWVAGGTSIAADQQNIVQSSDQNVGQNSANTDAAQSFTPSNTNVLNKISLYIKKIGNPGDPMVRIVADNSGAPSKTELISRTLNSATVTSNYGWVDIAFPNAVQLVVGQTYWIVIDVGSPQSGKYFVWGASDDAQYSQGTGKLSDNWDGNPPVWNNANLDFDFKTYMGGAATHLDKVSVGFDAHANTISDSKIGQDAYYQTIVSTTVGRTSYPSSPDPGPQDMPLSEANLAQFKGEGTDGGTQNGDYTLDADSATLGPIKIEGNMTITNGAHLTLTGTVYVTGDILLSNNCVIDLDSGYGANGGTLLNDGKVTILNNCTLQGSGNPASYLLLLSTNPSQDSASPALDVNNNAQNAILYASQGMLKIANNANLKEAISQNLFLSPNVTVTYEAGLANINFTSGPGAGFKVTAGSYQIK